MALRNLQPSREKETFPLYQEYSFHRKEKTNSGRKQYGRYKRTRNDVEECWK